MKRDLQRRCGVTLLAGAVILLTAAIGLSDPYSQDFNSWTTPAIFATYTNQSWVLRNGAVVSGEGWLSHLADAHLASPLLGYGTQSVSWQARKHPSGNNVMFRLQKSTDLATWTTLATYTNTSSAPTSYQVPVNDYNPGYIRLMKIDAPGLNDYLLMDNISITIPPAYVVFTNLALFPQQPVADSPTDLRVTVLPYAGAVISSVQLFFRTSSLPGFTSLSMSHIGSGIYDAAGEGIPAQPAGTLVQYYVRAIFTGPSGTLTNYYPAAYATQPAEYHMAPHSTYADMSVTGTQATNMLLVGDYQWQGVITPAGVMSGPSFRFSSGSFNWGDDGQSVSALPVYGGTELGSAAIAITGSVTNHLAFLFSTAGTAEYSIQKAAYLDFDEWAGAYNAYGTYVNAEGWEIGGARVSKTSELDRAFRYRYGMLKFGQGSAQYARSPFMPQGVGTLSFWYRHRDDPTSASAGFIIQKSVTGAGDWVDLDTVTDIRTLGYKYYSFRIADGNARYVRILNNPAQSDSWLCLDDVIVTYPGATVTLGNPWRATDTPALGQYVDVSIAATQVGGGAANLACDVFVRHTSETYWARVAMTPSNSTFLASIPPGPPGKMLYYFECTYAGFGAAPTHYPNGGPAAPNLLAYTNSSSLASARLQDFNSWTTPGVFGTYTNNGWVLRNGAVVSQRGVLGGIEIGETSLTSPLLTEGAGSFYSSLATRNTGSVAFEVLTSVNGVDWVAVANSSVTGTTLQDFRFAINTYNAVYVRLRKLSGTGSFWVFVDNCKVSLPPADVNIASVGFTPGYISPSLSTTISCDINSKSSTFPAMGLAPTVYHRLWPGAWNTTPMTHSGGNQYSALLPKYAAGRASYFIKADFGGFYYDVVEKQSPTFSPEAPQTASEPSSFHSYEVRRFASDYGYLSLTGNFETVKMEMIGDNIWQGAIAPVGTNHFEIHVTGYNRWTGAQYWPWPAYWGGAGELRDSLPVIGIGQPDGPPFTVNDEPSGLIIARYNLNDNSFAIMDGQLQDFNAWRASDLFFEESLGSADLELYEIDFDNWGLDKEYKTQAGADLENFEAWPTNVYLLGPTNEFPAGWYVQHASITQELSGNMACSLDTTVEEVQAWPYRSTLTAGLKQFDFKFRAASETLGPTTHTGGSTWNNYRVKAYFRADQISPMQPYFSLYNRCQPWDDFYECRVQRSALTQLRLSIWRKSGGNWLRLAQQPASFNGSLLNKKPLEFTVVPGNSGRVYMEVKYDGVNRLEYTDNDASKITAAGTAGLSTMHADVAADDVTVTRIDAQTFDNWTTSTPGSYNSIGWYVTGAQPNNGLCTLQPGGTITSPRLPYQIGDVTFQYVTVSGTDPRCMIYTSPTNTAGSWIQFAEITDFTTGYKTRTLTGINPTHRYLRWVNNTSSDAQIRLRDIYISSATNLVTESFASGSANWTDTSGRWYTDNGEYKRPGYIGPNVGFSVDIATTNNSFPDGPAFGTWTNVYNGTANQLYYTSTSIVTKTWERSFVRVKHSSGAGRLVIDDLSMTSWCATNNLDNVDGWRVREGWIGKEATGDNRLELWRSRANPGLAQSLRTPLMTNSVGSLQFDYKTWNGPTTFVLEGAYGAAPDTCSVLLDTVTGTSTNWQHYELTLNTNVAMNLRIRHISANRSAILYLDRASITDYAPRDERMWTSYNALITYTNQYPREFQPFEIPELNYQTCYLNYDSASDTAPGKQYLASLPYVQSPRLTKGIGEVSFWYRSWENDGTPAGLLHLEATAESPPELSTNWQVIGSIANIANTEFSYFTTNFFLEDQRYLRLSAETNGAFARVCLDNIVIGQPIAAGFDIDYLSLIPAIPLDDDAVRFEARLSNFFLDPSNILCRVFYTKGSNSWAAWPEGAWAAMELVSDTGSTKTYRTPAGQGIPAGFAGVDDVVQYSLQCSFAGRFSSQASPKHFNEFVNPEWYYPINLNAGHSATNPYYYVFSSYPGDVWINEINYKMRGDEATREYVELCGYTGTDLGNWRIDLVSTAYTKYDGCVIPAGYSLPADTNGYGFLVYGDPTVANVDIAFTTPTSQNIVQNGGIRLVRSMGAYEDRVCYGASAYAMTNAGYTHAGIKNTIWQSALFLSGTASNANNLAWDYRDPWFDPPYYSSGVLNLEQVMIPHNAPPSLAEIEITRVWADAFNVWIVFTANGVSPPVPWYATNLAQPSPWSAMPVQNYNTWSSGNVYTQRLDRVLGSPGSFYRVSGTETP